MGGLSTVELVDYGHVQAWSLTDPSYRIDVPSTWQPGDVMVGAAFINTSLADTAGSRPDGWTELHDGGARAACWYRVLEDGDDHWDVNTALTSESVWVWMSFRGVDPNDPIGAFQRFTSYDDWPTLDMQDGRTLVGFLLTSLSSSNNPVVEPAEVWDEHLNGKDTGNDIRWIAATRGYDDGPGDSGELGELSALPASSLVNMYLLELRRGRR